NREDMFGGNPNMGYAPFATDHATFQLAQGLIAMRKMYPALRYGAVSPVWSTTIAGPRRDAGIFAFERATQDQKLLVVLNTGDQDGAETCAQVAEGGACMMTTLPPGATLTDVMPGSDGKTFTVRGDGTIDVSVPARSGRVLMQ